jgi:hypothetical protein
MRYTHSELCKLLAMEGVRECYPELFVSDSLNRVAFAAEVKQADAIVKEWLEDGTSDCICK